MHDLRRLLSGRADLDLFPAPLMELEWTEIVFWLVQALDAEEKQLLPLLEREDARSIVQEMRYLRNRAAELERTPPSAVALRAFVAEIRAHAQRAERLGFRFLDA